MHGRKSTERPRCTWAVLEHFDTHDKLAATQLVLRCDLEETVNGTVKAYDTGRAQYVYINLFIV